MRVAFNARLLSSPTLRGWSRYTVNLLAELPALGVEPYLYTDHPLHPAHLERLPEGSYQVRVSPPMRYLFWEQRWLPRQCGRDGAGLLHAPMNFGLPWSAPCPRVLTLHDAIDQLYTCPAQSWIARLHPADIKARLHHWIARTRADRVITVSGHARRDLVDRLHVPAERVTVIHEAADPRFHQPVDDAARSAVRARHGLRAPYVFYVGGWERRKNVPFLVRAFAAARPDGVDLVLAGGKAGERAELERLASSLGIADRVRLLGWVEDAELPALYAEALCFVYPSEYEGFGLQLCEAMAVGCPVLAARATSLPEVLESGGETFSLDAETELARLLEAVARDPEYRRRLAARAAERSRAFSWARTARETVAVYRECLEAA